MDKFELKHDNGGEDKMTKGELIKMLQDDPKPLDTPIEVYLECTNNDKGVLGTITGLDYAKDFQALHLEGTYAEDEY